MAASHLMPVNAIILTLSLPISLTNVTDKSQKFTLLMMKFNLSWQYLPLVQ